MLPAATAFGVAEMVANSDSEKPDAGAVLPMLRACDKVPPTRWLASTTGLGVAAEAHARLKALPVMFSTWPATLSKLLPTATLWPASA